jgi:hypothetical protein
MMMLTETEARGAMARDIERIVHLLRVRLPGVSVQQLEVKHPGADDDGLWFVRLSNAPGEVQLESSSGDCPFIVESDLNNDRNSAYTVECVVELVTALFSGTYRVHG